LITITDAIARPHRFLPFRYAELGSTVLNAVQITLAAIAELSDAKIGE
jgi:hypothetical protein